MATPKKSKAKLGKNNSTGYLGVSKSFDKPKMFCASYRGKKVINENAKDGKYYFGTALAAALARDKKAFEIDGDKAKLNFPKTSATATATEEI